MSVLTAKGISRTALELLTRQIVLPGTVTVVPGTEFVGPNGGTITVRVPQPGSARTEEPGNSLTAADVSEIPIDVSLGHIYHLKNLNDSEATYSLEDFARQVTRVQVAAVATKAEDKLAAVMNALDAEVGYQFDFDASDADTKAQLLAAREFLSEAKAPLSDRFLAVSPDIASRVLGFLTPVDSSGSSDALRDAIIGRIYGMTVVESVGLDAGTAIAYHRSGFVFVNRAPAQPKGATSSNVAQAGPFALRQIFQYDASKAQDQSLLSTFAGAAAVYEDGTGVNGSTNARFVKFDTAVS